MFYTSSQFSVDLYVSIIMSFSCVTCPVSTFIKFPRLGHVSICFYNIKKYEI